MCLFFQSESGISNLWRDFLDAEVRTLASYGFRCHDLPNLSVFL